MRYIAFLRGLNVGGHVVKMERLRELFTELGLTNVRTYIQSGNVFFESEQTDRKLLTQTIEQQLQKALGYAVPVFLRTIPELEQVIASAPFHSMTVTPDMRLCVLFMAEPLPTTLALPLSSAKKDMAIVQATGHDAYVVWYIINGRPPATGFLEKTLGAKNTTRFFHTTIKILEAAKQV